MKKHVKIKFYSGMVTELATFTEWSRFAEKVIRLLNSEQGEFYPDAFYFLHTYVEGKAVIYAGSKENESHKNDPYFTEMLDRYEPPSRSGDSPEKRRKGS